MYCKARARPKKGLTSRNGWMDGWMDGWMAGWLARLDWIGLDWIGLDLVTDP